MTCVINNNILCAYYSIIYILCTTVFVVVVVVIRLFKRLDAPRVLQFRSEGKRFTRHAIYVYTYTVMLYSWYTLVETMETRSPALPTLGR